MRFMTVLLCGFLAMPQSADAFVRLEGYFIAMQACDAFQSKNRKTNPGNVTTTPHMAYEILGINKKNGDYFQIRTPGAPGTETRWVRADCGLHVVKAGSRLATEPVERGESVDNLLALSWQPAFCEIRPGKSECEDLNNALLPHSTQQLSIHGLWPQPRGNDYCGVPTNIKNKDRPDSWSQLPPPAIDTETEEALKRAMPGFASYLHHHEWIKHGTCYYGEGGADEYYDDTLHLTNLVNGSPVADLFTDNIGREITGKDIRTAFDNAFGEGAGERVQVTCSRDDNRTLINEIRISLKGEITPESDLGALMLAANATDLGCERGLVDAAGLQ